VRKETKQRMIKGKYKKRNIVVSSFTEERRKWHDMECDTGDCKSGKPSGKGESSYFRISSS
jgi:hypothetical protein